MSNALKLGLGLLGFVCFAPQQCIALFFLRWCVALQGLIRMFCFLVVCLKCAPQSHCSLQYTYDCWSLSSQYLQVTSVFFLASKAQHFFCECFPPAAFLLLGWHGYQWCVTWWWVNVCVHVCLYLQKNVGNLQHMWPSLSLNTMFVCL